MRYIISMTLKAFSILLLVLILSPIASGQSGGRNPKRSCDQTGKLKFPICTTVTGKNADGTLKHGRAEPPGGGETLMALVVETWKSDLRCVVIRKLRKT
ncbi:hypothetical protein Pst134EA_031791 [Puccinia striiformis f. sp. tritici]|uniref:uncharacterized protein n=1 Tax=Puccinia striiformis f. sp. tritici TaxID=168172 RepID=UPI002007EB37|nr:uncharacterized protein Pst134EA_031791 [Puccinia striiformis f. sp. tritici]KAH9445159.1 hypothetical protein Pst134EA_031791 [Puccinia striiformis f. sp. tritici]